MLDNGMEPVNGRVWFVAPVVRSGRYSQLTVHSDAEMFAHVTDVLGFGDVPAIVFDPRLPVPEIRFFFNGLEDPDAYNLIPTGNMPITIERVLEAVGLVYKESLITPEARTHVIKLWSNPVKRWASEDAEAIVQALLKPGLKLAFPTCNIRLEQLQIEGRLDIEIKEVDALDSSQVIKHAVLELKVLRSYGVRGRRVGDPYTRTWVESGVTQASAYRDGKHARAAALCCFNMHRLNSHDSCFDHVREIADALQVELRRWYIYATSKQYRDELAAIRLAATS
jgi:hypothetical protein